MKIMITGALGTLATSVVKKLSNYHLVLVDKLKSHTTILCDISDFGCTQKIIEKYNPNVIIHLAANTDVDYSEKYKNKSFLDNFITTKNIVDVIKGKNIYLIYTSTASVFSGEIVTGYKENDKANPLNYYAESKFLSEKYIKKHLEHYTILRLGWLIGEPQNDKKFFGTIVKKMLNNEKKFWGVEDTFGALSFADDISNFIEFIIQNSKNGIFHICSDGFANRYEIIKKIAEILKKQVEIIPVENKYFNLIAKRPKYEILNNEELKKLNVIDVKHWEYKLKNFLSRVL